MPIRCPNCGAELELISADLSDAARAILERGPELFLRGEEMKIQVIADTIGYSYTATHDALVELARAGKATQRKTGPRKSKYSLRFTPHRHK